MFRVGLGQDSHQFTGQQSHKPLVLGGILIVDEIGLKANSDGDVMLHALFNALSSAIGQQSIGAYADTMCQQQNIKDSSKYLKVALKMVDEAGFKVNSISLAVEAKKPRFPKELTQKIQENIGKLCGITSDYVGLTVTSGEAMGRPGTGDR